MGSSLDVCRSTFSKCDDEHDVMQITHNYTMEALGIVSLEFLPPMVKEVIYTEHESKGNLSAKMKLSLFGQIFGSLDL